MRTTSLVDGTQKEQKATITKKAVSIRKCSERIARETGREQRRRKNGNIFACHEKPLSRDEQQKAALKRAAELVWRSIGCPFEMTRAAATAKAATNAVPCRFGRFLDEPEKILSTRKNVWPLWFRPPLIGIQS